MTRALLFAVVWSFGGWSFGVCFSGAGCGDNLAATIEIDAPGARWMAVRSSPDAAWERYDGEDVRFEARGAFDVAVVCREDIGGGFSIRATPDDGFRYGGVCRYPGGVLPQFAITGRADLIFVSVSASYLPNIVGQDIPAGTYDVVAAQLTTDVPQRTERVQVLRDVVVDGTTPIAIDIEQFGLPPAETRITLDGAPPRYAYVIGETANGTWFRFDGRAMYTLPVELTRPTDRQLATVYDDGNQWAEVPVHAGDNDIALPGDAVDATFSRASPAAVTWRSPAPWDQVTFEVSQWTTTGPGLPRWKVTAYAGAFRDAGDGTRTVELAVPDLADWQTRWMADVAAPHYSYASWQRARLDGGRGGVYKSEQQ